VFGRSGKLREYLQNILSQQIGAFASPQSLCGSIQVRDAPIGIDANASVRKRLKNLGCRSNRCTVCPAHSVASTSQLERLTSHPLKPNIRSRMTPSQEPVSRYDACTPSYTYFVVKHAVENTDDVELLEVRFRANSSQVNPTLGDEPPSDRACAAGRYRAA
jgi:hypothetical protein